MIKQDYCLNCKYKRVENMVTLGLIPYYDADESQELFDFCEAYQSEINTKIVSLCKKNHKREEQGDFSIGAK